MSKSRKMRYYAIVSNDMSMSYKEIKASYMYEAIRESWDWFRGEFGYQSKWDEAYIAKCPAIVNWDGELIPDLSKCVERKDVQR